MPKGFLPNTDLALLTWATHFADKIVASPEIYGLSVEQASEFMGLRDTYAAAVARCSPNERNKTAVIAKNQARTALKQTASRLSSIIQGQATVSDSQRVTLGLNVRKMPTKSPVPDTEPGLQVVSSFAQTVKIRLYDKGTSRRGKPPAVIGASVFTHVGPTAPTSIADWTFRGNWGNTSIQLAFAADLPPGTAVWFTASWFNGSKRGGPGCSPVRAYLAGGGVAMMPLALAA